MSPSRSVRTRLSESAGHRARYGVSKDLRAEWLTVHKYPGRMPGANMTLATEAGPCGVMGSTSAPHVQEKRGT
jgi:hypothetical protein